MKSLEEIFDQQAQKGMVDYELKGFKRTYPTLFKVIKASMRAHTEQYIDLIAEVASLKETINNSAIYDQIDKNSILELKKKIK